MLFLRKKEVLYIQQRLIEEFGGIGGLRDEGALESALTAAENRAYYEQVGVEKCAATYAYHLTQAHAFVDGNKRIAAAVAEIFLELNGAQMKATNQEVVDLFIKIASGELTRDEVDKFFKDRVVVAL